VASHFRGLMSKGQPVVDQTLAGRCQLTKLAPHSTNITRSEIAKLHDEIKKLGFNPIIKVQYGWVKPKGVPLDAKLVHAFEAALRVKEGPRSYCGSARTFKTVLWLKSNQGRKQMDLSASARRTDQIRARARDQALVDSLVEASIAELSDAPANPWAHAPRSRR